MQACKVLVIIFLAFLAATVVPIQFARATTIADPTLGYTTIGASSQSIVNRITGSPFTATEAMRVASLSVYLMCYSTDGSNYQGVKVKAAIYQTSGAPQVDSYVSETSEQTVLAISPTWITFTFPNSPALLQNNNYSLYCWANNGNLVTTVANMYYSSVSLQGKYLDTVYSAWPQPLLFELYAENQEYSIYALGINATYAFTFHGVIDEDTGLPESGGVTVTAHYQNGSAQSTFNVDGTYIFASYGTVPPEYFSFALAAGAREYWLSPNNIVTDIYIFNTTGLAQYHVSFVDLGNVLSNAPYVEVDRNINGSMFAVEKRKVDETLSIYPLLQINATYSLTLYDHNTYVIGSLYADGSASIQLPITNINFPSSVTMAYQYVRMYADRAGTSISLLYSDSTLDTLSVVFTIAASNGTVVYTTTQYSDNLNVTWTSAISNVTYIVGINAQTAKYGLLSYRNTLYPAGVQANGFGLPLGSIGGLTLSTLFPVLILFCVALIFSQVNAYYGALACSGFAVFFAYFGWLTISASMLVFAIAVSVLYTLSARKRRDIFY